MDRREKAKDIIDSKELGVSFSVLNCREYDIDWRDTLNSTTSLGFKRFRLMSYWNLIEAIEGTYDFSELDEQLKIVKKADGRVTLAIGIKQPRWPETHLPDWAKALSEEEATKKYIEFHKTIIKRYRDNEVIESWQLENEFWLRSFGKHFNFSRKRLVEEFNLIRALDPDRPIIMSVSSFLSLPLGKPTPDIYATSIYRNIYNSKKKKYTHTWIRPWMYRVKRVLITLTKQRGLIVHELQTEPWGPKANWEMSDEEQYKSMNPEQIKRAVEYSKKTGISYADMWGAEWWYWRTKKYGDTNINATVRDIVTIYNKAIDS